MGKKSKKYYAVKIGLVPGLYLTWGECQQNINGFSGAVYKSFDTQEEAEQFLSGDVGSGKETDSVKRIYTDSEAVAYVDGSYNPDTNEYAYGAIVFYDGGEEHFAEKFNDNDMAKMRNVAGEIEGAKRVMHFCVERNMSCFVIIAVLTAEILFFLPTSKCNVILGKTTNPLNATIGILRALLSKRSIYVISYLIN